MAVEQAEWGLEDVGYMRIALALARAQLGRTGANPAVGCVIVNGGQLIGQGATGDGGRPHGEAAALAAARKPTVGSTVFVTLEPCAHKSSRGPSCADILIDAGIVRLVCCLQDPDPRTYGQGFERLRRAGIIVEIGLLKEEGRAQVAEFAAQFDNESEPNG